MFEEKLEAFKRALVEVDYAKKQAEDCKEGSMLKTLLEAKCIARIKDSWTAWDELIAVIGDENKSLTRKN
jgi:hypothetical protein